MPLPSLPLSKVDGVRNVRQGFNTCERSHRLYLLSLSSPVYLLAGKKSGVTLWSLCVRFLDPGPRTRIRKVTSHRPTCAGAVAPQVPVQSHRLSDRGQFLGYSCSCFKPPKGQKKHHHHHSGLILVWLSLRFATCSLSRPQLTFILLVNLLAVAPYVGKRFCCYSSSFSSKVSRKSPPRSRLVWPSLARPEPLPPPPVSQSPWRQLTRLVCARAIEAPLEMRAQKQRGDILAPAINLIEARRKQFVVALQSALSLQKHSLVPVAVAIVSGEDTQDYLSRRLCLVMSDLSL